MPAPRGAVSDAAASARAGRAASGRVLARLPKAPWTNVWRMDAMPDNEAVLSALDRSGFLLEQRVAGALDRAGFTVRISAAYVDPDEQKNREIDVVAVRKVRGRDGTERAAWLVIAVECKSSPMPHVAFLREWNQWDRKNLPWEVRLPYAMEGRARLLDEWVIHRINSTHRAVQVVRIDRDNSKFKARSDLHETGLPTIKAAYDLRKTYGSPDRYPVISFPAAVVNGELYTIESGDYESPTLTPTDFVVVSYENRSPWMSRDHVRSHYDLVRYASIENWIMHVNNVTGRVAEHLPRKL